MRQLKSEKDLKDLKRENDGQLHSALTYAKILGVYVSLAVAIAISLFGIWLLADAIILCYNNSYKNNPEKLEAGLILVIGHIVTYVAGILSSIVYSTKKKKENDHT